MNWNSFNTQQHSFTRAFEIFCTQLFERHIYRTHGTQLSRYAVLDGAGGDGGVEAYAEFLNGGITGLQAKWFRTAMTAAQVSQIKSSIDTAMAVRPGLTEYIICVPRNLSSKKKTKSGKVSSDNEEEKVRALAAKIKTLYPKLKLTWWFDSELLSQLQLDENNGIRRFWFEKTALSLSFLQERFAMQRTNSWLKNRYAADLNGQGKIAEIYEQLTLGHAFQTSLGEKLQNALDQIRKTIHLISLFLTTDEISGDLLEELEKAQQNLAVYEKATNIFLKAVGENNLNYQYQPVEEYSLWLVYLRLDKLLPTNIQKTIIGVLRTALKRSHEFYFAQYLERLNQDFHKSIFIVYGKPGTGKTQGLAHSASSHIKAGKPALILPAPGTANNSWTSILSAALELPGWNKDEILAALEAMAITQNTFALICVDGLEEDWQHKLGWYDRINESAALINKYPRVRLLFSAREYFHDSDQISEHGPFEIVHLPGEGDISIDQAAVIYFKPQHFNIKLDNSAILDRIDSLFTLKLFCERYQNKHIKNTNQVATLQRDLLNDKATRLNKEYLSQLGRTVPKNENPAGITLLELSRAFYASPRLEHDTLTALLHQKLNAYTLHELGRLLDFLADNGVLVKSIYEADEPFASDIVYYHIAYQSLIEHFLTEDTLSAIKLGKLNQIPEIFFTGMVRPFDEDFNRKNSFPNETILLNLFIRIFEDTGQLVDKNNFLSKGFSEDDVLRYQLAVLAQTSQEKASSYRPLIDNLFSADKHERYIIFKEFVIIADWGPEYFHEQMVAQPSVFARDNFLWSQKNGRSTRLENDSLTIELALMTCVDPMDLDHFQLSTTEKHNGLPLIFAWCLSALDQNFRDKARKALARWALSNCSEFILLLDEMLACNDPQVIEDLAAITQGLGNALSQKSDIKALAEWALKHNIFPSVVTRTGFRAIIEKAISLKLIDKAIRLQPAAHFELLDLDNGALSATWDSHYPIESDLAHYVIKNVYQGFFENNYPYTGEGDTPPEVSFLKAYAERESLQSMGMHQWALAAGVHYMKHTLGLNSKPTTVICGRQGTKSDFFSLEEKYTWLAVTYLQSYVARLLPYHTGFVTPQMLESYELITSVPDTLTQKKQIQDIAEINLPKWIIPETLTPTALLQGDVAENITAQVNEEQLLDFEKWLVYDHQWLALWHNTLLYDKTNTMSTRLLATALLVKSTDFEDIKFTLEMDPTGIPGLRSIDRLHAGTDTETYANPTDVAWMDWIGEVDESIWFNYGNVYELHKTITEVINNGPDGEKFHYLPSKIIRKLLKIKQFQHGMLTGLKNKIAGILHETRNYKEPDRQIITYADRSLLDAALKNRSLRLFWLAEVNRTSSVKFNEQYKTYPMKTRKYLIWEEDNKFQSIKYWDDRFGNKRDDI